jgi:CubicO group peptidase (beta-lactamase class C family)
MKTSSIYVIIILCFFIIGCFDNSVTMKIDDMIREYRGQDRFSGTALVAKNGEEIYYQGFGYLDRENQLPNSADQMLKIGSIVKDFTAVLILQLMEQNQLNLDDAINKYLDDFPNDVGEKVTIRQLLRHESGFGDYLRTPDLGRLLPELKTVNSIMQLFKDQPLMFEPGSDESYSNSGYTVLGAIIEKLTGTSYFEAVEKNILNPLKMRNTTFDWQRIAGFEHKPKWYMRTSTGRFITSPFNEWPSPSGGAYSTGRDLLKFELSLQNDNKLLSDQSKIIFYTRFNSNTQKTWNDIYKNPDMVSAKAGGAPGSNSVIIKDWGRKYIIIVLANFDEPIAEIVGKNIYRLIKGEDYLPPKPSIFEKCFDVYRENGVNDLKSKFGNIIQSYDFQDPPDIVLNQVGYDLLNEQKTSAAIEIFTLNTDLFPEVANTWDSLGEAYMLAGDKDQALKNYHKSLELNPNNENAKNMTNKLGQ